MEAVSSASASSSKTVRGWRGFGVMDPTGSSAKYAPSTGASAGSGRAAGAAEAGAGAGVAEPPAEAGPCLGCSHERSPFRTSAARFAISSAADR